MSVMTSPRPSVAGRRRRRDWHALLVLLVTVGAVATVLAGLDTFVLLPLRGMFNGPFEDFAAYSLAAHNVASGLSPYTGFDPGTIVMSGFIYPPFTAVVFRPLANLSVHAQQVLWLWVALAALIGGAVITARALLPASWPRARIAVLVALTFPPATYNLWHGQMNTVIFLLLSVALSDYLGGRRTRCGVVLGVAAGIKLAPIILLVVLVRRGWWRGVAAGIAAGAATGAIGVAVLGWAVTRQYVASVLPILNRDNGWIYNQTWNGVVNRLAAHSVLSVGVPLSWPRLVTLTLSVATIGLVLLAVSRGERSAAERGVEFACGVVAMLLVGTLNWYPVYVDLLIPVAAAVGLARERGRRGRALGGWALTAFAGVGVVGGAAIAVMNIQGIAAVSHGPWWWLFLQACSLPALLAAGLLVVMARSVRAGAGRLSLRGAAPAR